jgi:hypothetical protein
VALGGAWLVLTDLGGDLGLVHDAGDHHRGEWHEVYEARFTNAFGATTTTPATLTVKAPACAAHPPDAADDQRQPFARARTLYFAAGDSNPRRGGLLVMVAVDGEAADAEPGGDPRDGRPFGPSATPVRRNVCVGISTDLLVAGVWDHPFSGPISRLEPGVPHVHVHVPFPRHRGA